LIEQLEAGASTYVISDRDGKRTKLHAQHLAKFVAYADDRELVNDAVHVPATMQDIVESFIHVTRPPDEKEEDKDERDDASDDQVDASDAGRDEKKSTPAEVVSAKAPPKKAKAGHSKSKPDEKKVLPLVSRISTVCRRVAILLQSTLATSSLLYLTWTAPKKRSWIVWLGLSWPHIATQQYIGRIWTKEAV